MCNAYNHPPGCGCGWGGYGHRGRRTYATPRSQAYRTWNARPASTPAPATYGADIMRRFTVPNALCPVCGAPVFFYKSPDGGRVYFDELGPPWPKHFCIVSLPQLSQSIALGGWGPSKSSTTRRATDYRWQESGWRPFICDRVVGQSQGLQIIGNFAESPGVLKLLSAKRDLAWLKGHPLMLRKTGEDTYTVSTFRLAPSLNQPGALEFPVRVKRKRDQLLVGCCSFLIVIAIALGLMALSLKGDHEGNTLRGPLLGVALIVGFLGLTALLLQYYDHSRTQK